MVSIDPNDSKHCKPIPITCPKCGKETLRSDHECLAPPRHQDFTQSSKVGDGDLPSVWINPKEFVLSATYVRAQIHRNENANWRTEYVPVSKLREAEVELKLVHSWLTETSEKLTAAQNEARALRKALEEASQEFERIATLRDQMKDKSSTHWVEKQIAVGSQCFAKAAKTEISRVLSIYKKIGE